MGAMKKLSKKFKKQKVRILLLGLDNAGKTTILNQLHLGDAKTTVPTVGFNVEEVQYKNLTFDVWDVGGQDRLRPLWRHYYRGVCGIIFVIDSADQQRFDIAKGELHQLMREVELQNASLCILANKQDVQDAMTHEEVAQIMETDEIETLNVVLPTVARTGEGLDEALDWIAENVNPI